MFSKAEAQQIKKEFWTSFAEAYPRKWLLYDTKIKDVSFKFYVDNKKAMVLLDIEPKETEKRKEYFDKLVSLKAILTEEYLHDALYEEDYYLDNGKAISRIWVELSGISLYNMASWATIFRFFSISMDAFERFFKEYNDIIRG
ncbi:hypothetical protein AM493_07580 [Flavobacterium akiainvivens]|uniref:DUF4268 domain-containing protein n=1 Tax=Flavobacterium akiainvivens TaxID=1202724 RepID=A0A0M8MGR7_9FLAO|nr:DUF4268 domain-containing protein [Flavobacterium akiainvivens]KOS05911.1 hypothetical protein AM493_07580 [Flavobacterium akiainvivens]SFQ55914.1 protein of unknown function [Flavobacterium akiainvivens]